jgi:hypothetical protein
MNYFSYVVEHDYGLAPNPFGGYCTLAVCKPAIRKNKNLELGDWIIGTGSKKLSRLNHLIYAMQVEEKITFDEYWNNPRFHYKRPIINGSLVQMYGDNFYHKDEQTNEWIQEPSAHSTVNKEKHTKTDTSADSVLISRNFYYLGDNSIEIPEDFSIFCKKGPGMKYKDLNEVGEEFITWVITNPNIKKGIGGDPISWIEHESEHNQINLQLF